MMKFTGPSGEEIVLTFEGDLLTTTFIWPRGGTNSIQTRGEQSTAIIATMKSALALQE